ncbi:MAG: type IV pilus biogenesis protein PilM, partial [Nitrospira sp.]
EIARTIDYFKTTSSENEITRVLLCGGGAKVRGLAQQLRDRMHVDVDIANPFNEIDTSLCGVDPEVLVEMGPLAAVGVGLALRTVGDR